ncbi:hypothetical protein [Aquibacillus rhizosphaerae]|uniref:Uncharacterized protein n=1 Tax=Aquibacillus rhizosphaerae TaxID=3051431 RepID=A0ABT7L8T0_9BACI|nr:hypothetical protein [Aquibacillus sp. LR5S19]MDL4841627.1 hypothetical protein [Aquibacillus sp. LR5S19]
MELIDELLEELSEVASDYNLELIDQVELNLKLQLIISKIDKVKINFKLEPLQKLIYRKHTKPFDQLLFKAKYKAIQSLIALQHIDNKELFYTNLYLMLANKLYFNSVLRILINSCNAYIVNNQLEDNVKMSQVFIYEK